MKGYEMELKPCPWCAKQPVYCPDNSYGEEVVFCPDRNECPASPSTDGPVGSGESIVKWNSHRTTAEAAKDAEIAELRFALYMIETTTTDRDAADAARAALKEIDNG